MCVDLKFNLDLGAKFGECPKCGGGLEWAGMTRTVGDDGRGGDWCTEIYKMNYIRSSFYRLEAHLEESDINIGFYLETATA